MYLPLKFVKYLKIFLWEIKTYDFLFLYVVKGQSDFLSFTFRYTLYNGIDIFLTIVLHR